MWPSVLVGAVRSTERARQEYCEQCDKSLYTRDDSTSRGVSPTNCPAAIVPGWYFLWKRFWMMWGLNLYIETLT